jgi:hypothetical protein
MRIDEFPAGQSDEPDDWDDDAEFDDEEDFSDVFSADDDDEDIEAADGEETADDESYSYLTFKTRRIRGLENGLSARRMIERLKEQRSLNKELSDFDNFEYLN